MDINRDGLLNKQLTGLKHKTIDNGQVKSAGIAEVINRPASYSSQRATHSNDLQGSEGNKENKGSSLKQTKISSYCVTDQLAPKLTKTPKGRETKTAMANNSSIDENAITPSPRTTQLKRKSPGNFLTPLTGVKRSKFKSSSCK